MVKEPYIINDIDKISFVRSCIQPNSEASRMMSATAFRNARRLQNYAEFRENLFRVFGWGSLGGPLAWMFRMRDRTRRNFGDQNPNHAQALAGDTADDAEALMPGSPWVDDNDKISLIDFYKLMEYLQFILCLKGSDYHTATKHEFKKADELVTYAEKITSDYTASQPSAFPVAPVTNVQNQSYAQNQLKSQKETGTTKKKWLPYCKNCQERGHYTNQCEFKEKHKESIPPKPQNQPNKPNTQWRTYGPSKQQGGSHRNPPQGNNQDMRNYGQSKQQGGSYRRPPQDIDQDMWCHIHEARTHNTEDCREFIRCKNQALERIHQKKLSGEGPRASQ